MGGTTSGERNRLLDPQQHPEEQTAAPDSSRPGGEPAVVEAEAQQETEIEEEEEEPSFNINFVTLAGKSYEGSVTASMKVSAMYEVAGEAMDALPWTLQVMLGVEYLDPRKDLAKSMTELSITEGTELTVVRRQPFILKAPGTSRYQQPGYWCDITEVREAGWDAIAVSFVVHGDGSLGPLQRPEHSMLTLESDQGRKHELHVDRRHELSTWKKEKEGEGGSKISGDLTYTISGVEPVGKYLQEAEGQMLMLFQYGSGGYDRAVLWRAGQQTSCSDGAA